ncbi:hypothetical protein SAPIO_CDS3962 [Scedosporium apiospermum]|uniref:Uncharacterized protein n=1 Tax=Pseudallescheria apiosperma TaxID=563466 RepID=A0A084G8Z8_PSEDA|nr:uncharacterized protein SAPIO_CDS3962 [Scedosporium apiospermum]KEZ43810.1 hypothetical protein SAPIO_CDS3962 [Scedosporium apiospermum]
MDPSTPPPPSPPAQTSASSPPPNDSDRIFIAFDTYPWAKDPKFLTLISTLTKPPNTPTRPKILFARSAYFTRILGLPVSVPEYTAWLSSHPSHPSPDDALLEALLNPVSPPSSSSAVQEEEAAQTKAGDDARPAWQTAAPKADLYVDRSSASSAPGHQSSEGPAYPERFAELIRCIKEGLPVPGVREIPETVVRDPSAKPFGARGPAPRKPWEKAVESQPGSASPPQGAEEGASAGAPTFSPPAVDQEFPPLETEEASEPGTTAEGDQKGKVPDLPDVEKLNLESDPSK